MKTKITTLGYLIGGIALGTIMGILMAPYSGKETRDKLKRNLDDSVDEIKNKFKSKVDELADEGINTINSSKDRIKSKV
jgi:gas vesicle protein